jgi:hypothetical protein
MNPSRELNCESGDVLALRLVDDGLLLSVDDVERTLAGPDGRPAVPTVKLTFEEATQLLELVAELTDNRSSDDDSRHD